MKVEIGKATLYLGDSLQTMLELPDNSVDSIVTDPPYGLLFMGKKWDYDVPSVEFWEGFLRVLKPGGHLLAFAGTRTQHRMAVRIEDAGFEIRDMIAWVYGSGFPKSHNLKEDWNGWGTALKPALEPITVARKPLIGTVAENVLKHGTGALNIDGCRVATDESTVRAITLSHGLMHGDAPRTIPTTGGSDAGRWPANLIHDGSEEVVALAGEQVRFFYCAKSSKADRNDGCEEILTWENVGHSRLTESLGELQRVTSGDMTPLLGDSAWSMSSSGSCTTAQSLSAIKSIIEMASKTTTESKTLSLCQPLSIRESILAAIKIAKEHGSSLAELAEFISQWNPSTTSERMESHLLAVRAALRDLSEISALAKQGNIHSTVKPTDLMRYLCRLVTPPGGVVLDPFMGSGSTGKAAMLEGFRFIGSEMSPEYLEIAKARIEAAQRLTQQELDL